MIINVLKNGKEIMVSASKDKTVLNILQENDIYLNSPCGGNGTCGKCKIQVISGEVTVSSEDYKFFSEEEIKNGFRLACKAKVKSDCTINITSDNDEGFVILNNFKQDIVQINSEISCINIDLNETKWNDEGSFNSVILQKTNSKSSTINVLKKISSFIEEKNVYVIKKDNKIIDILKEKVSFYGIAIDIGTTTIALNLVDLQSGKLIANHSCLNTQRTFGADVISRIQAATDGNLDVLNSLVKRNIIEGIQILCEENNINEQNIYSVVVAGNTTMIHLLLGLNVKSLGLFPFTATTTEVLEYKFKEIFDETLVNAIVTILPGISTYVGSDIVSGMLYSDLLEDEKPKILIDIGTNGEIVIGNNEKVLGAATAAGPAFEGGNITWGIGSIPGAISSVKYSDGEFNIKVIGNKVPLGICGSAIIDLIAEGIKNEWIDYTGLLCEPFDKGEVYIADGKNNKKIILSQADVREVQLAKSAIISGIECLVEEFGCSMAEVSKVYLAGGFGNNINVSNTIVIGMIPEEFKDKIEFIGNSSLGGAVKYLLEKKSQDIVEIMHLKAKDINLSNLPSFNNAYMMNMVFENGKM